MAEEVVYGAEVERSLDRVFRFLDSIGLPHTQAPVEAGSFLEGIEIREGGIVYEKRSYQTLAHILHEAGHIAITPARFRPGLTGDIGRCQASREMKAYMLANPDGLLRFPEDPVCRAIMQIDDTAASAWSYAACIAAGVDTRLPFYGQYDGDGEGIHDMLSMGAYFGVNGLAAAGMTTQPNFARLKGVPGFPHMNRWLQA